MKIHFLIIALIFSIVGCTGQDCETLPRNYNSYNEAIGVIRNADFSLEDKLTTPESDWINSIEYFSCDRQSGFLIIEMQGKDYLFNNVPTDLWEDFKLSESKGSFYHQHIREKYRFGLN